MIIGEMINRKNDGMQESQGGFQLGISVDVYFIYFSHCNTVHLLCS